jgi:hypothetical protein
MHKSCAKGHRPEATVFPAKNSGFDVLPDATSTKSRALLKQNFT